tara:strand:- start:65344 stop:67275 length:1932 start_codon:yes stop_codon:yes gene_type:complete
MSIIISTQAQIVDVVKVRGSVYVKKGSKKLKLKKGLKLRGPFDVYSLKKSYAILRTQNQDRITIGPDSQIYIFQKSKQDPSLISLIKGKLRAQVKKKSSNDHKLLIKTKSAALGVRGTDFILTYNDKNQITSNVTLSGEVDFYKESDSAILDSMKENFDSDSSQKNHFKDYKDINDKLSNNTVSIKKGSFSGAFPTYDRPLSPTKISSQQLQALSNTSFVKEKGSKVIKNKHSNRRRYKLTNKNLIPEPKGNNRSSSKQVSSAQAVVRPGGVVDLETGIYVMPPEGSIYDKQTKKYILPEEYGGIDSSTGEYIPPNNVKLDPYQGFVSLVDGVFQQVDKFETSVNKLLDKYKKLTRVDLQADTRYYYSYKSYENYYGEFKNISDAESMVLSFQGSAGRHIYNSKRYLHYIKASLESIWHNRRDEPQVQRNDRLIARYGYEFHIKHQLFQRKASLVTDLTFNTIYQDYRNQDKWDYYSESTKLEVYEKFKVAKSHSLKLGTFAQAFQGYRDNDHGNIYGLTFSYIFDTHLSSQIILTNHLSRRYNRIDNDIIDINILSASYKWKSIFRKTDLTFGYEYQTLNSDKNILINTSHYNDWKVELERRRGEHFVFTAFYEFLENNSSGGIDNRDFVQQLWGAGLKFKF